MMHFHDAKIRHFQQEKEQEVYGCFTRPQQSTNLFLKRIHNNPSHQQFCNQTYQIHDENRQVLHVSNTTSCKMSLKKDNAKTLAKTHQNNPSCKNIILNKKMSVKNMEYEPQLACCCDPKTSQKTQKTPLPYFSAYNQINTHLQTAQTHEMTAQHSKYHPYQHHSTKEITWNTPKIHFQIESPKVSHQRCKSENHLFQNNLNQSLTKIEAPSKNFMSDIVEIHRNQENQNHLNKSTINQKNEKRLASKLSLQTILTSDSQKKQHLHFIDHHKVQDSLISNKSEATLNNTAHSFHSFVSNSKKLKKIDEVLEVQSLGDENEAECDKESIVLDREDQKCQIHEEDFQGGDTWRQTQRRLIKVSKLLKSQSLDIL